VLLEQGKQQLEDKRRRLEQELMQEQLERQRLEQTAA
jgi:hypothetical protein